MKKTTISITYDEEKLSALRMYAGQKGIQIEAELKKALDGIYNKTIPAGVREYIELCAESNNSPPRTKNQKPVSPAASNGPYEAKTDE